MEAIKLKKLLTLLSLIGVLSTSAVAATESSKTSKSKDTPIDFPKNLIFVAPHPDDILLTFAGLIDNNKGFTNHNVTQMIVYTLSQWTENPNAKDLSPERINRVSIQRYLEENSAINEMYGYKARMETYGYSDAPIRLYQGPKTAGGGPGGNFSTFGPKEMAIYEQLVPVFENKLKTPDCAMFVLMANGSHIDHFTVREAVISAARHLGSQATCKIYFGEDQPYTGAHPEASKKEIAAFQQRLNLQMIPYKIEHIKKIDAFAKHYISQYSDDYAAGIEKWAEVNGGKEDIFYWDPKNYANAAVDSSCTKDFCK